MPSAPVMYSGSATTVPSIVAKHSRITSRETR